MNSLTTEQMAKKFAQYLGCNATAQDMRNLDFPKDTGKIVMVDSTGIEIATPLGWHVEATFNECQLILKPLSSISDEHAIEVAKILKINFSNDPERSDAFDITGLAYYVFELFERGGGHSDNSLNIYYLSQYLTYLGYDLPQFIEPNHPDNGKTMQELGLAVYL